MNVGVPVTPIMIRRAKGTILYVRSSFEMLSRPTPPPVDSQLTLMLIRFLQDVNDREILDFTSGQMSSILGHSHPEIVEVVSNQVATLDHLLSSFISEPVADLADLLTSLTPDPLDKTFFLNTGQSFGAPFPHDHESLTRSCDDFLFSQGSETNEAAIKIAKHATGKFEIVAFAASYREHHSLEHR